jgi:hypothetical protein
MIAFRRRLAWVFLSLHLSLLPASSRADNSSTESHFAYFEQHIRPLLAARCYSCHSERAKKSEGGLQLDSRAGWIDGGDSGTTIIPGDIDASLLLRAVRYSDPDLQMPPDRALPESDIAHLEQWVRLGAPDPRDALQVKEAPREDPSDPIAGREHWAYRPLAEPQVPHVAADAWPRNSIDAFVLTQLEAANLSPSEDADRRTLVRRVYVQLIGLPPTPEQVSEFLSSEHPHALEQLVDRLLESPHFGERWGRHWLDLSRYADSNGLDENFLLREAWRYRNRVVQAFNEDTPFDQFLTEQIAGDLLPYDSIEQRDRQRVAAGFLVVGPKVLLVDNKSLQRMDVADEQMDTIGKAILGQTLGCARCHDHKFDPIPTADYYSLAGIFASTQVLDQRYMLNEQRFMERLVGLGPDGDHLNDQYEKYWRELKSLKEKLAHAKEFRDLLKSGDTNTKTIEEFTKNHADSVSEKATDASLPMEDRFAAQQRFLNDLENAIANPPAIPPRAMAPVDREKPANEHIRLAGQYDRLGDEVPRGFLRVLAHDKASIPDNVSGRLELAHWLTNLSNGAGHLTARVLANRIWHHLIGCGIVRTVDNFGRTGEPPSHPELLDHLAAELIRSGWSIKSLVRQVVLSRTFAMSSHHDENAYSIDPGNRLLWRAHRRRFDPETLRDAMLLAAGTLDLKPMDSTVSYLGDQATAVGDNKNRRRTDFLCRSIYLPVIRNDLPELFEAFDFANPHSTTGMRSETMVATQGLFILNDDSVMTASQATAQRVLSTSDADDRDSWNRVDKQTSELADRLNQDEARVDRMFELIVNEPASAEERAEVLGFINQLEKSFGAEDGANAKARAWSLACQALFASSRFQIVE